MRRSPVMLLGIAGGVSALTISLLGVDQAAGQATPSLVHVAAVSPAVDTDPAAAAQVEASATGERVEVESMREEYSQTFANPDLTFSDHHGTATVQWDASNTPGTRLKRFTDPFGVPRGTSTTFADDKVFLGKPNDSGAGLTHVGAREYDAAIGRFLSVDPLLDTTDPSSFNGYSYANNDPVNLSDPSGLQYAAPGQYYGSDGGGPSVPNCVKNCGAYQQRQDEALAQSTDQDWNGIKDNWGRNFSAGAFHSAATLADQGVPQMVTHWHPGDQLSQKFDNKVGADRGSPDYANGGFVADLAMAAIPGGAGLAKDAILGLRSIRAVEEGATAANTGRVFTSADAHVAGAANAIETALPGRVVGVNSQRVMANGLSREVDIDLGNLLVQVKSGRARGITGQIARTEASTGTATIGYAPGMTDAGWRNAASQGVPILRSPSELLAYIREFG